jgi:adenosylmethionine-8-amino-7-oxononanoate aminotransferase
MELKGLIPGQQKITELAVPHWKYGTIVDGMRVVDPLLHYGCFVLGFEMDGLIDTVTNRIKGTKPEIAESIIHSETLRLNHPSYELSNKLYEITDGYRSFFSLSGSDANEGAVKLASAYHRARNNHGRNVLVSFKDSYHGSTFLTSSLGADSLMEDPFYTLEKYHAVRRIDRNFEYNSDDWNDVMCVMIETCSYGNDMTPNSRELWDKLSVIQDRHDVILIIDDIFIGGGKTGNYVGWKHLPVKPDIFTMGKAITGGAFPLSTVLYNDRVHEALPENFDWQHGFTYNYSLPGILSALEYIKILEGEKLLERHDAIVGKAIETILSAGFEIINRFGLLFMIRNDSQQMMYVVPINANDEYFEVLGKNLMDRL